MKSVLKAIIVLFALLASVAGVRAKTVSWVIPPSYDTISRYHTDFFLFEHNGKWGMVKIGDQEVLPAKYTFITSFVNGYALAGVEETTNKYHLQCIVSETGSVVRLNDKYYLQRGAYYFSEGKLAVSNTAGKYGYIDPSGEIVVKCQFDDARPFKQGWAPVKQGRYYKYVSDAYDRNPKSVLAVDFHYGDMTVANCFTDGKAPVAYNKDYAQIDLNGHKVKSLSQSEYKEMCSVNNAAPKPVESFKTSDVYKVTAEGGLYGLAYEAETVAIPQFSSIGTQYSDGYIVASQDGKCGLLHIENGNYSVDLRAANGSATELEVDRDDKIEDVKLSISMPAHAKALQLMVDRGDGHMADVTASLTVNGNRASMAIAPVAGKEAENCTIRISLENDGILVADASKQFALNYPIKLTVSPPAAISAKADENDNVTIYSNIFNDSNKPVTVTVKLTARQTVTNTYTIEANSSVRISLTEKVTSAQTVNATVSLSTGERASSTLHLEPF